MKHRLLSVLLTFATFISSLSVPAVVSDTDTAYSNSDAISFSENIESAGEEKQFFDEKSSEFSSSILQYISADDFQISDFAFRIPEQEDLNTFVFQRNDGTKAVYILDENVKFIDDSGKIIEKDITLVTTKEGYGIAKSDIDLTIPGDLVNGVALSYGNYNVRLYPQIISSSTLAEKINNSVVYPDAFGSDVSLRYTPTLSGLKEDIILEQFVPNPSYTFTLKTNGLFLYENTEGYYLAVDEKSDPTFYLGNIIVYDAVGKPEMGTASIVTISDGFEYNITISVDVEYLSDPTTVYPVTIDPSITISDTVSGSNAIEDSPIYAGYPNRNFATYLYNPVGTADSDYGIGRTVVRLNGLINSSIYSSITASQITSVTFNVNEASGSSSQYVNLYPLTSNTTWIESTVTWNNVGSYSTSVNYGASMTNGKWTSFNITNLVKAWKNGTYSAAAGFILKNQTESNMKNFYSSEYSTSANRPYVVMTYNEDIEIDYENAPYLSLNTFYSVSIADGGEKKCFKFKPTSTGFYTFESSSNTGDPKVWLYNNSQEQIGEADDISSSDRNFRLTYHLISGVTYYFATGCFGTGTGTYSVKLSYGGLSSSIKVDNTLSMNNASSVSNVISYKPLYLIFTPQFTGEYLFYSSQVTSDPQVWLYDLSLNKIGNDSNSAGNYNFRLVASLTAGKTYYIVAGHNSAKTGSYKLNILSSVSIPTGTCHIKNIGTALYLDIHGPGEQELVHQWSFHSNPQEQWLLQRQSDGYYTIRSQYDKKYYVGISGKTTGTDNIKLYPSISDATKWKVFASYSGYLFFEPKTAEGKVLYAPNSSSGTELQLGNLGDNSNRSKWNFEVKSSTAIEGQRMSNWCWVTSARMLTNHYYNVPDARYQNKAVEAVKGYEGNFSGNHTDAIQAAGFYRSNDKKTNVLQLVGDYRLRFSETNLRQFLDDGHVVYIARGHYDLSNNRNGGHATLIIGYTTIYNNGSLQYRYIINDPWPASKPNPWDTAQVTTGQTYTRSYQWICNGRKALNTSHVDDGIWDRYVVVKTEYSGITLTPVWN